MDIDLPSRTMRQAFFRLLPILVLAYLAAFVDRVNVANAALTMNASVGLNAHLFGLGAGLFFVSYFIFGPPSNLVLERVGVRYWMAPMVSAMGTLSMAMALVRGPVTFLALRFLLGAAEAGLFPGVILYLTYWFPVAYRSRMIAAFTMAIPASLAVAGPISNAVLHMSGLYGIQGWQWLFIMEGLPAVILGFVMFLFLPDRPHTAKWLTLEQKAWLTSALAAEAEKIKANRGRGRRSVYSDPPVVLLSLIYLANITTNLGVAFFLPLIVKALGATTKQSNYISAIPYLAGMFGIYGFSLLSERFQRKRQLILTLSLGLSAIGLIGAGFVNAMLFAGTLTSAYVSIALVSIAAVGIFGAKAPFWSLPSLFLTGNAVAGGIAAINSMGNLGGFIGPSVVGWVKDTTHSYGWAFYALAGFAVLAVLLSLVLRIPGEGNSLDRAGNDIEVATTAT